MGPNILGKDVLFEKRMAGPRVSINSQNKKIIVARPPDPTANNGGVGSLTIIANDTSPHVSVNKQTVRGLLQISHLY
jgi:hypothetical protein